MSRQRRKRETDARHAWFFGTLSFLFLVGVFFVPHRIESAETSGVVPVICAIFAALSVYKLPGQAALLATWKNLPFTLKLRATAPFAVFFGVLMFLLFMQRFPVRAQIEAKISAIEQQTERTRIAAEGSNRTLIELTQENDLEDVLVNDASLLSASRTGTVGPQTAVPPRARELARKVESRDAFVLGLQAIAEGRAQNASQMLEKAKRLEQYGHSVRLARIDRALGVNALYQAHFDQAVAFYGEALKVVPDDSTLLNLAGVASIYAGQPKEARRLLFRALHLQREKLGPEDPEVARSLNNVAGAFREEGEHDKAALYFERAIRMQEKTPEPNAPELANTLTNLAVVRADQNLLSEAERLYRRALPLQEHAFGRQSLTVANTLGNLSDLERAMRQFEEAERLADEVLDIRTQLLGFRHPLVAVSYNNLGGLMYDQAIVASNRGDVGGSRKLLAEAMTWLERARGVCETSLEPTHPYTASVLGNLAEVYRRQGRYDKAEAMAWRALHIRERRWGPRHPEVAVSLNVLSAVYFKQGKFDQAEPLLRRALDIAKHVYGPDHPMVTTLNGNLAKLLRQTGRGNPAKRPERHIVMRDRPSRGHLSSRNGYGKHGIQTRKSLVSS